MTTQQQEQRPDQRATRSRDRRRLSRKSLIIITVLFLAVAIIITWILSYLDVIPGFLAPIFTIIITVLCAVFAFFQSMHLFIPANEHESHEHPTPALTSLYTPSQLPYVQMSPIILQAPITQPYPVASPIPDRVSYRGIVGLPPPTDPRTIQQREQVVREVYTKLIQPDITSITLTGIGGAGKSTLAALIYRYVEEQRSTQTGPFLAETLWLTIDPAVTFADLAGNLFEALGKPLPDLGNLAPQNQAVSLFNVLNSIGKPHLIILDQFENLLNWDTGHALTDRPGVGEWLDILNSQQCTCRLLLTSRPRPVGTREYPPTYMQEYAVGGLEEREGVALLRDQGIQGTDEEMRAAVSHCAGHAFSLTLLASLLRDHHLNLATLFKHASLWTGDIATNLLDQIYTQKLNNAQRELLLAFSVYREPVSIEATLIIITEASRTQTPFALKALVTQHLVEAIGEGRYQLHAIVADYAQTHSDESNEQANQEVLRTAHARAAQYYLSQVAKNCPLREQRRKMSDVHDLIEVIYQLCKAEQWREAYGVMEREKMFDDLRRWGGNAVLLELCLLLGQQDTWSPEPGQLAHIYNSLAWVYNALGRRKWARENYEQSLKIYQDLDDHRGESQVLNALGWSYLVIGQARKALAYYEWALNICEDLGDRKGEEYNRTCLGWVYNILGQKRRALEYCRQALSIGKEIGDRWGESRTLNSLGQIYIDLGQYKQALEYLEEALHIRRDKGNRRGEGTTLNHMGRSYRLLGEHELALRHVEQTLNIGKEIGDLGLQSLAFHNLGLLYIDKKQYERAQGYLEQALHSRRELEDRRAEGRTINALGKVYGVLGKDEQAQKYYEQALNIAKEIEDHWGEATALLSIGTLYLKRDDYDAALACFLLAKRLFKMLESPELNEALARLDDLRQKMGEEQFSELLANIEPNAQEIVDQALHDSLR